MLTGADVDALVTGVLASIIFISLALGTLKRAGAAVSAGRLLPAAAALKENLRDAGSVMVP